MKTLLPQPAELCARIVIRDKDPFPCDEMTSQAAECLERLKVFNRFQVDSLVVDPQGIRLNIQARSAGVANWVIEAYMMALAFETGKPLLLSVSD